MHLAIKQTRIGFAVVGEMPALTEVLAATLLVDVTWPPLPSLVASSAALPDVAGRTQGNLQYLLCLKKPNLDKDQLSNYRRILFLIFLSCLKSSNVLLNLYLLNTLLPIN